MFLQYQEIAKLLLAYRYFILFPAVMFEGPITSIIAGFLSSLGYMKFWVVYPLAVAADLTSDVGYYALGRWGRKSIIEKYGKYLGVTMERIERFGAQFKIHGGKMIVFGKIADPLSASIQTAAGISGMNFKKYFSWNIAITIFKSLVLITIGFYFGEAINQVNFYQKAIGLAVSAAGIVFIVAYFIYRKVIKKRI